MRGLLFRLDFVVTIETFCGQQTRVHSLVNFHEDLGEEVVHLQRKPTQGEQQDDRRQHFNHLHTSANTHTHTHFLRR